MINNRAWVKGIGFVIGSAIHLSTNYAVAQISPDTTLPTNSQVTKMVLNCTSHTCLDPTGEPIRCPENH